jgi:hypothetical protein
MFCQYKPYYYDAFPIEKLRLLDFSHMHFDGLKTGGMKEEEFLSLRDNIEKNGLINPIVVEVDSGPVYRIAMGNNRVEALKQLGHTHVKALVLFCYTQPSEELGPCLQVNDSDLESFMSIKHPGDETWRKSGWCDRLLKFVRDRGW